jgi:hypothetical protein
MLILNFPEFRFPFAANIFGKKTTRVKAAARRGVDGAGDLKTALRFSMHEWSNQPCAFRPRY